MNKSGSSKISLNTSQYEQKFYGSPLSKNSNLDDTDELLRYKIGEDNPSIHSASRISGSFTRYRGGSKLSRYQSSPNYPSHYDENYQYPMNSNSQLSFSPNHFASNPVNRYDLASTPDSLRNTSLHGESVLDNSVANPSLVYSHRGDDYSKNYSLEQKKHDEPIEATNGQASDTASTQQQTSDSLHDGFDSNSQDLHRFGHLDNEALVKRTQKLLDETLESYDKEAYVQGTQWSDQRYQGHASITTSHELKHRQKQNVSMEHDRSYSKPKITDSATNRSANYYPDHHKLSTNTSINIDYASPNDSIETADLGIREDMEVISNVSSIPMDADLLQRVYNHKDKFVLIQR
ncbi:uncharacterized protein TRIADDRAFT_57286 [Trichoplax adhaerens]|uniref:Uncharacterized protein n=1 Tax=Trichoplax adhaerens TaxID=10228 RepID=B3RZ10_TRIAD|nr:hypothetical protein TRIADDRAFT_57286 [Trichoplax adhaerens]EDV23763.1 hypothetical protein TRIADDRAFT_57286 [Trichoplax adhaerens]|eukprot:XP_002113289.1 hypothetical protein TRIADDRAFT_57286 [Trichoplax adhaerens]